MYVCVYICLCVCVSVFAYKYSDKKIIFFIMCEKRMNQI